MSPWTTRMAVPPRRVSFDKTVFARNCSHLIFACSHPSFLLRSFGIPCVRSDHTRTQCRKIVCEQRQVSFVQSQGLSSACLSCWGFQTMAPRKVGSWKIRLYGCTASDEKAAGGRTQREKCCRKELGTPLQGIRRHECQWVLL